MISINCRIPTLTGPWVTEISLLGTRPSIDNMNSIQNVENVLNSVPFDGNSSLDSFSSMNEDNGKTAFILYNMNTPQGCLQSSRCDANTAVILFNINTSWIRQDKSTAFKSDESENWEVRT